MFSPFLKNSTKVATLGILFAGLLSACSTEPKIQEFPDTANASDEVLRLKEDLGVAAERQVNVLSPSAFERAQKALSAAEDGQKNAESSKTILHSVALGRAYLRQANLTAETARANMEDVVAARRAAIVAGAPKVIPGEFNKADDRLRSVTSDMENGNLQTLAESRPKLQSEYLDVELKAIQESNLGPARATIATAVREGAQDWAKQSLAIATKAVGDAEAYIFANRHQTNAIKEKSSQANAAAAHLLKITRASNTGKQMSPEETALHAERTQKALGENINLKMDQAFSQKLDAVRAEFTNTESEVYRQGNRLILRLRSLEFPVNQAVLRASNFPLLAKVAKVLKGFEDPSVIVEGHTDSDGGKELNTKLSQERAQAVTQYLVSSAAIAPEKIEAIGYGFERPRASNKTEKGKAQNRRVDVIISAGGVSETE